MAKNRRTGIAKNLFLCLAIPVGLYLISGCATSQVLSEIKNPPAKSDWLFAIDSAFSDGEQIVINFLGVLATTYPFSNSRYHQYSVVFSKRQLLENGKFDFMKDIIMCHCQLDRSHIRSRMPQVGALEEIKVFRTTEEWKNCYSNRIFRTDFSPAARLGVMADFKNGRPNTGLVFKIIEIPYQEMPVTCYRITVIERKDVISVFRSVVLLPFAVLVDIVATPLQWISGG